MGGISNPAGIDKFEIVKVVTGNAPAFSVPDTGAGNITGGTGETIVPHNLGYAPAILTFLNFGDGADFLPIPACLTAYGSGSLTGGGSFAITNYGVQVDDTNVYFQVTITAAHLATESTAIPFKCYLMRETAN